MLSMVTKYSKVFKAKNFCWLPTLAKLAPQLLKQTTRTMKSGVAENSTMLLYFRGPQRGTVSKEGLVAKEESWFAQSQEFQSLE